MPITYHVVVPFDRNDDGDLVPGEAKEAPNRDAARRRAQVLASTPPACRRPGVLAVGRPGQREFVESEVIAEFGEVDRGALQG